MNKKVGILGFGDVGKAIAELCKDAGMKIYVRDLERDQLKNKKIDILHVAIPEKTNKQFVDNVVKTIKELSPNLTIIHSSITPGTTRKIYKLTKMNMAYSPIIGVHTYLKQSVKNFFPKMIAAVNSKSEKLAVKHLKKLGLKVEIFNNPDELEAAKLLDLIYYGWNILYCKWVKKYCDKFNYNFDTVYTKYNQIYNQGYQKLMPNVVRPVLVPRKGPIGGHCLIPDTEIIHNIYKNDLTGFLLKQNSKFKNEVKDEDKERKDFVKVRDKELVKAKNLQ